MCFAGNNSPELQARAIARTFFESRVAELCGITGLTEVTERDLDIWHGDMYLDLVNGRQVWVEVKAIEQSLIRGVPDTNYLNSNGVRVPPEVSRWVAGTHVEVARADGVGRKRWANATASMLGIHPITFRRVKFANEDLTIGQFEAQQPYGYSNLLPISNGAIRVAVDVCHKTLNLHSAEELLAATRVALLEKGPSLAPGRCDAGTILQRHVAYGSGRFLRNDDGLWWPVGPKCEFGGEHPDTYVQRILMRAAGPKVA